MNGRDLVRFAVPVALFFMLVTLPVFARDAELARRQSDQRQARAMARELVSTVLDLQLRQLEENGLTDLPLYQDIRSMRGNLAQLVEGEMATVVEQLAAVGEATGAEREARLVAARRSIREIVVRLSVERQALMRRLKSAEIVEHVRRVINLQTSARTSTAALPNQPTERRPAATLKSLDDQRDVRGLYDQLAALLADVATWDGPIATAASEGFRILKDADAPRLLDESETALEEADFTRAVARQDAVLAALRQLLGSIEQAQGAADTSANRLADAIAALREQQQELQDTVRKDGLKTPPEAALVEAQQEIARSLAEFTDELANDTNAAPLRAQAEAAAKAATAALFLSDEEKTLAEQQRTIDRLAALEQILRETSSNDRQDRSAAQLAEAVVELTRARDELQLAQTAHTEAVDSQTENPTDAAAKEQSVADRIEAIPPGKQLPPAINARLADAVDAARTAAQTLQATTNNDETQADDAVAAAGDALQRAAAAIEEAIADTQRAAASVRIGELARAAEAIERAAAAERELAAHAGNQHSDAKTATEMQQVQADVSAVVAKTAEGVREAAPAAAETLAKALASSKQVEDALAKAQASGARPSSENDAARSDAPAREADTPRSPVAAQAIETAALLTNAAAQLRREIGTTANALGDTVDRQLEPIGTAQQAVQSASVALQSEPEPALQAVRAATESAVRADLATTIAAQSARAALQRNGDTTDAADALDRAAIALAAREMELRRDQQIARQLAQLAERQQTSSDMIASSRQQLAEAPGDPEQMTPAQREQAKTLHAATRQFSAAQRATGQGAAMVSGQQQIMNPPLREALQAAERLPVPQLPAEPIDEQVAEASEARPPAENGEQATAEQAPPGEGQTPANTPSPDTASSGQPGQAANAQSPNGTPQPTGLGTGLVPAAPDETARMMAGPDAQAALAAMAAAGMESMEDVAASETTLDGDLPEGMPLPDGMNDSQTASTRGPQAADSGPADSDSQSLDAAPRDAAPGSPAAADAPWFAKLPPEVRAAIRASSSQPAPKGYEGRLKRYFESVE